MNKYEMHEHLEWASAQLSDAIGEIQEVLQNGAEHLEGDDADWLCSAIEHASDARHSLEKHGPYPRLDKEVLRFDED